MHAHHQTLEFTRTLGLATTHALLKEKINQLCMIQLDGMMAPRYSCCDPLSGANTMEGSAH